MSEQHKKGKTVIITGQSGINKQEYLERGTKQEYVSEENREDIKLFNIGNEMYEEARKAGGKIRSNKILDLPLPRLNLIRRSVFKDVLKYREIQPKENIIVNTHSCFRWKRGLFHAFDFDLLNKLNPDMYITLIDDVDATYVRLTEREDPHVLEFSFKDIMVWREEEIITAEMVALTQGKSHFVVPRKNPVDTIFKLMFRNDLRRSYLSFPITKVRDKPDIIKRINSFREEMAKNIIVFDPYTIEEKRLLFFMYDAQQDGETEIEVETLGKKRVFKISDIQSIERDINGQIISRDYKLINQSDMIIAYIPEVKGEPNISAGVQSELNYAHDLPRDVYVIWPSQKDPSVWVEAMATKIFKGENALDVALQHLQKEGL